jgi:hypothetical protein
MWGGYIIDGALAKALKIFLVRRRKQPRIYISMK